MNYRYEFDDTHLGNLTLSRRHYEILQNAYCQLRNALEEWNQKALAQGSHTRPYNKEVNDINRMTNWGDKLLRRVDAGEIMVEGISVASARYAKAALMLLVRNRQNDRAKNSQQGWPDATLRSLDDSIDDIKKIAEFFDQEPSEVLWELISKNDIPPLSTSNPSNSVWDVFISHASEDKEDFVRPLAEALRARGLSVWFDEFTLTLGDSLRRSIDSGLARSRFGVVILSPNFLEKGWPQKELDGLIAREIDGAKVILPVWHNISANEILSYSPMLADRLAIQSSNGLVQVVKAITDAVAARNRE